MASIFDRSIGDVLSDGVATDRLVRALSSVQETDYVSALQALLDATERFHPTAQLRGALVLEGASLQDDEQRAVEDVVAIFERHDGDVKKQHDLLERFREPETPVSPEGFCYAAKTLDVGGAIADPVQRERRWQAAKHVLEHVEAPDGNNIMTREQWDRWDLFLLDMGLDLLATGEQRAEALASTAHKLERENVIRLSAHTDAEVRGRVEQMTLDRQIDTLEHERRTLELARPGVAPRGERPPDTRTF